jgi:pSer/pThr/pTyr-binding forkhead associated (FHA) protein
MASGHGGFPLPFGHGPATAGTGAGYPTYSAGAGEAEASGPEGIALKILSANEPYPVRTLSLPASIGRVGDPRMRTSARNGLFTSRFLSRHHALRRGEGRRVVIEDLGSCNGTFVNGVAVRAGEAWPIADGDLLQFGSEDDDANSTLLG